MDSVRSFWSKITEENPEHPFTACVEKMKGKIDDPEAFCASTKDLVLGTTMWRGESRKKSKEASMSLREQILYLERQNPGALRYAAQKLGAVEYEGEEEPEAHTGRMVERNLKHDQLVESLMEMLPSYLDQLETKELRAFHDRVTDFKRSKQPPSLEEQKEQTVAAVDSGTAKPVSVKKKPPTTKMGIFRQEVREHKGPAVRMGTLRTGDYVRVKRTRDEIIVTDLTNAGDHGETVDILVISFEDYQKDELADDLAAACVEADFEQVQDWVLRLRKITKGKVKSRVEYKYGQNVRPGGKKLIRGEYEHLRVICTKDTCHISDLDDADNRTITPALTAKGHKSLTSQEALCNWVRDNKDALRKMTWLQIRKALKQAGIEYLIG